MTPRNTKRQRLEAAGYGFVPGGWLPFPLPQCANDFIAAIDQHAEEVERIAETRKPSGRPKKPAPTT